MASVSWPTNWLVNTDWSESLTVSVVSNQPEVGLPITRMRSHNVKHALKVNVDMTYNQLSTQLPAFLFNTKGGSEPFNFTSPSDSTSHSTYIDISSGQPYTFKRKDDYTYTVSFSLIYYTLGAF